MQICKNCGTRTTPFWRKDKHDGRPLCNACGLYFSKNDAPRPKILWKAEEGCVMDGVEGQFGLDQPPPTGPSNPSTNPPGNTPHASTPGAANGSGPSNPPANPPGMPNVMIVAAAAAQQSLSQSGCTPAPLAVAHALQCAAVDNPAVAQALAAAGMPGVTLPGAKGEDSWSLFLSLADPTGFTCNGLCECFWKPNRSYCVFSTSVCVCYPCWPVAIFPAAV